MFPQHGGCGLLPVSGVGRGEPGGGGVAGGGLGGGAGTAGPVGRPGQRGDGLAADLPGIAVVGHGVQRVQVVPGDHLGHFLAVTGEGGAQVRGDLQVPGLAVPAGQGVVGDLPQQVLGEPVAASLRRQPVRRDRQHLAADQLGQRRPHHGFVLPGDRDQRLGRERGAQHGRVGHQPPHPGVQGIQPSGQQGMQAVRHGQLPDIAGQPVDPLDRLHDVPVDQRPDGLHREQRDPLALVLSSYVLLPQSPPRTSAIPSAISSPALMPTSSSSTTINHAPPRRQPQQPRALRFFRPRRFHHHHRRPNRHARPAAPSSIDEREVLANARVAAAALWNRM